MTAAELLEKAKTQHREGRLQDAERLYREALNQSPEDPDALHLLGVVALQFTRPSA
jgi:Flp pilus assembly protein TadD